ncbi:hypothetical protein NBO_710g0001 [Nosema bombycis CQ1]|uniref:Uncharacterized protein n=1 Tax=Nosema bombycis (strain CQ1 / CVCC 102059) TaxID=578461 RepID=R0KMJ0_NOSB1|nr:hypothetical protein NBO_710g0001 [Nosema bombycis CQ1]|eukprot:EOB11866.1 hypothetical protein NBO_710g0001 [Nosema bombycis CQ1]
MDLLVQACENKKLLSGDNQENSYLLTETPTLRKFLDGKYPQTLKLFEDAIDLNRISEDRNNETLKFLSNVFTNKKQSDEEAFNQLAKMLVKNEHSGNNVPNPQAPTTVISQDPPRPFLDGTVNESNGNQVSHIETTKNQTIPNDGSPNEPDFSFVGQNEDSGAMETTKSAEPKKRNKRSSKSHVNSNTDFHQSKDKSKESREKSSKKNKRSRRSTKDSKKPKSKNKHKRSKRQKSKGKTEISGHDGKSNLNDLDTDMMGDDPSTYNPSTHSEAPFTKTVDTKPTVVDSKTNDKSSTSNKNNNSKLFNSYYPEEYKRFVPLNPAIAYRRPKMLFLNDDNQIIPKLKTVVGGQSQGDIFEKYDIKPQKIVEVPKNRLVLTFTVSRSVY